MPSPQGPIQGDWNQQPATEAFQDASGGVISKVEPYYIGENNLAYLKNGNLDTDGVRKKRYGCKTLSAPGVSPSGIGRWIKDDRTKHMVGVWGTDVYTSTGNYTWTKANDQSTISLTSCLYGIEQGRIDKSGDVSALFLYGVEPWSGVTMADLVIVPEDGEATMNASFCPRALTWWQGRLWMGNLSNPDLTPTTLLWSNIFDGWDIDPSNTIEIDAAEGDEIMALVPARGSVPRLYIFKRDSVHALDVVWGSGVYIPSTENTIDTTASQLHLVTEKVGCVAPKTIVYTSGSGKSDIFFLARDGFRSIQRVEQDVAGGAGQAISEPIDDVIQRINWSVVETATATIYDHKVFLSIPVDGATTNNLTIIFDLVRKVWVGENDWDIRDAHTFDLTSAEDKLFLQWEFQTAETLTGLGATSVSHVFQGLSSDSFYDPSLTSITFEEHSRAFLFGSFTQKKRWNSMEVIYEPATTTVSLSLYVKVDEQEWVLVDTRSIDVNYEYPILPAALPWNFEQQGPQIERYNLMDVPPGKRIQLKFTTDSPAAFGIRMNWLNAWPYVEQWE